MTPAEQIRAALEHPSGENLYLALAALDALEAEHAEAEDIANKRGLEVHRITARLASLQDEMSFRTDRVWLTRDEAITHRQDLIDDGGWDTFVALLDERIGDK